MMGFLIVPMASARAGEGQPQLLVLDFRSEGVDDGTARALQDITSSAFADTKRFGVLSGADISDMLDLEAQKQTAGCESSSCIAEIAGALGADYVVTGRITRLGSLFLLKLALLEPAKARTVGQETLEAKDLESFLPKIKKAARRLTSALTGEVVAAPTLAPDKIEPRKPTKSAEAVDDAEGGFPTIGLSIVGAGVAVAALGVIGVVIGTGIAASQNSVWLDASTTTEQKDTAYLVGMIGGTGGVIALGIGLAVFVVTIPTGCVVGFFE